jgi:hypothetical protein
MLNSQAGRSRVTLMLVFSMACRTADHGDAQPDTARPSADSRRPPAVMVPSAKDTVTVSHPHAGAPPVLIVGPATIVLDSTTLAQVQTALGPASIAGGMHPIKACYVAGAKTDRVTVRLLVVGEGADVDTTMQHALATIPLLSAAIARGDLIGPLSSPTPKRCAPLSVPPAEIRWAGGLRLGMPRAEVDRLLGAPNDRLDDDCIYQYDDPNFHEVSVDTASRKKVVRTMHVLTTIQVRYDQDVATRIEASYWKEYVNP